ncbi:MAG: DNA-protecting protein DprA [Deltaproteobacteria bacterium]|nr:DNA-protecting protein DprA [Deltaproteobacteria bacterium]
MISHQTTLFDGEAIIPRKKGQPARSRTNDANSKTYSNEALNEYLQKTGAALIGDELRLQVLKDSSAHFALLFYRGNSELLNKRIVSVVGTRGPSAQGIENANRITKLLSDLGFIVMSGLAKGIDTVAHRAAFEAGNTTIAVLGTPIHKVYPAENKGLAEEIAKKGLLLSPSLPHEEHGHYLFPRRNRLMALLSEATIIIEAGPTSGVVHQAAECLRQGRKLILLKPIADNRDLPWIPGFIKSGAKVTETPADLKKILL